MQRSDNRFGEWFRECRVVATICALLLLSLSATGCAIPQMGSYLTTIPKAVKDVDSDVIRVMAYSRTDGLGRDIIVDIDLNRSTVSTEELRTFLETIVPLANQPGATGIEVNFNDFSSTATDTLMGDWIDISESRAELFASWELPDYPSQSNANKIRENLSTLRDKVSEFKKHP